MDYQELIDRLLKRLDDFGRGLPTNDYDALVDGRRAAEAIGSLRAFCHTRGIALEQAREEAREWKAAARCWRPSWLGSSRSGTRLSMTCSTCHDDTGDGCTYCAHYGDCGPNKCLGWKWRGLLMEEANHDQAD